MYLAAAQSEIMSLAPGYRLFIYPIEPIINTPKYELSECTRTALTVVGSISKKKRCWYITSATCLSNCLRNPVDRWTLKSEKKFSTTLKPSLFLLLKSKIPHFKICELTLQINVLF